MPISTNPDVITAFTCNRNANARHLISTNGSLFSYGLEIARWIGGQIIVFDYTATGNRFCSQTTSTHVGMIKREVNERKVMLVEFAEKTGLIK